MKENKGITLIALVITIIVLLILAGVAIAMLSGDNGILTQASKSADYNAIGTAKDEIALQVNEYVSSYYEYVYVGGTYIGTSTPTSVADAVDDALTDYTSSEVTITYTADTSIVLTSGDYSCTGTITSDSGAISWGSITSTSSSSTTE